MKNRIFTLTLFLPFLFSVGMPLRTSEKIAVGDNLPHGKIKMKDISNKMYSLNDLKKKNGLLVVFAANKCIAVKFWGDRLMETAKYADDNDIGLVWVNSNQVQRIDGESLEDMKNFAAEKNITFPYVIDEDFLLANTFGVEVTPTSYLFDSKSKLIYQGLVDDNMMDATAVKEPYLANAMVSLVRGSTVEIKEMFGRGCKIPRE